VGVGGGWGVVGGRVRGRGWGVGGGGVSCGGGGGGWWGVGPFGGGGGRGWGGGGVVLDKTKTTQNKNPHKTKFIYFRLNDGRP